MNLRENAGSDSPPMVTKDRQETMTTKDRSFTIAGSRTGFLLVQGLGGTPLELRMAAKGIASGGFTVHCCQLAGHCGTEEELLATNWPQWYASVEAALTKLEAVCDTI